MYAARTQHCGHPWHLVVSGRTRGFWGAGDGLALVTVVRRVIRLYSALGAHFCVYVIHHQEREGRQCLEIAGTSQKVVKFSHNPPRP